MSKVSLMVVSRFSAKIYASKNSNA